MFLTSEHCSKCGKVTDHHNGRCSECDSKAELVNEAIWKALPIEAKVESLRRRIEALERPGIMDRR